MHLRCKKISICDADVCHDYFVFSCLSLSVDGASPQLLFQCRRCGLGIVGQNGASAACCEDYLLIAPDWAARTNMQTCPWVDAAEFRCAGARPFYGLVAPLLVAEIKRCFQKWQQQQRRQFIYSVIATDEWNEADERYGTIDPSAGQTDRQTDTRRAPRPRGRTLDAALIGHCTITRADRDLPPS